MCGIVGIVGRRPVAPILVEGLKRLEYRGYDSAGIATLVNGHIDRRRAEGKIVNLERRLVESPLPGTTGIGHTRWATHGVPSEANAHPHANGRVAVVHNGIIENYQDLTAELTAGGAVFESQTDTEVVVHLITHYLQRGEDPVTAAQSAIRRLHGAFALAIIFAGENDLMVGARRGSPLALGYGEGEMFLGSDAMALAPLTRRIAYLEEGDMAILRAGSVEIRDEHGKPATRKMQETQGVGTDFGKGNFPHFMLKEIYEQPAVIGDCLRGFLAPETGAITLPDLPFDLAALPRATIVACGTSFHAGLVARYWFERIARLPVDIDVASEFRYRDAPMTEGGLAVFISQSGETADTLAALRHAKARGQHTLAVVNVAESSMAREADAVLLTHAGPEIGVASTKAFTTQLTVLAAFTLALARARGAIDAAAEGRLSTAIAEVPERAADVLHYDAAIKTLAAEVVDARTVLYLGRGTGYPIALEGALKLKEISYIHAEGFAAGEMKHGPIALIDKTVPIIVIAPSDDFFEKTASNMQEVIARGGRVIFLSDAAGIAKLGAMAAATIEIPTVDPFVAPILYTIPVQLLAYHVAVLKGTDVDQPRNLAKSVTVE
ncbi:MAG TPA: glutamine--fructose-6-phosphate transaminase (isomerizing) [Alphaproteobacteria bacterium]|jgi:glucosamine--fructose-6-phosphate aminotransferase (isomerizing)